MVELEEIFDPKKDTKEEKNGVLLKSVKVFSERLGESSGTSTFITIGDSLETGSKIFLIKKEPSEENPIRRDLIEE